MCMCIYIYIIISIFFSKEADEPYLQNLVMLTSQCELSGVALNAIHLNDAIAWQYDAIGVRHVSSMHDAVIKNMQDA